MSNQSICEKCGTSHGFWEKCPKQPPPNLVKEMFFNRRPTPAYQATERIGELFCNKLSRETLSAIEDIIQLAISESQKEKSNEP